MEARELKEYRDRWKAVVAIEKEEQRQANLDFRWRQLNSLVVMAIALGLVFGASPDEVQMVRCRWNLLKDLSNDLYGDELGDRS
jgi:hypothetical protein